MNPESDSKPCVPVTPSTNTGNTVSSAELFAVIVISGAVPAAAHANCPLPFVDNNSPLLPSDVGNFNEKFVDIVVGANRAT